MFERDTGQVFREWTVPARLPPSGDLDWSRTPPLKYHEPPSAAVRPLVDMAISVIAKNIGLLEKKHIEPLPTRLVWRLWRFLEARYVRRPHRCTVAFPSGIDFESRGFLFPGVVLLTQMLQGRVLAGVEDFLADSAGRGE